MIAARYEDIARFLTIGILPSKFPSTEANFRRDAMQYTVDNSGALSRRGLQVVKWNDRNMVYISSHCPDHCGRGIALQYFLSLIVLN